MKMDKVANSGNDEFYTPLYAIKPITHYIRPFSKVWCPFDTDDSLFVKFLRKIGCTVIATHISMGTDFFNCDIPDCDYIISNPPLFPQDRGIGAVLSNRKTVRNARRCCRFIREPTAIRDVSG